MSYILNGKVMIIRLIAGLIKKHKISQYFPKPLEKRDINVKADWSNYAKNADLKNARGVDTSQLAWKSDLAS